MRCPDARSRYTDRPAGVVFSFQIRLNKIEPSVVNRCFNLFTKDNSRSALADEIKPDWPEVTIIGRAFLGACGAEWLARATTCPNRSIICPFSSSQCVAPDADSGKEVALGVSFKIVCANILNAPCIYIALGDMPCVN
jgi:hypothetical protein